MRHVLLALTLGAPLVLRAQAYNDSVATPRGICHVWAGIPGGSTWSRDSSYHRCALDRAPVLAPDMRMPPSPFDEGGANGSFTVIVNADGSVDSSLTRAWSIGMDSAFYRQILQTMRRWRFVPGLRAGKAVRNGVSLEVVTSTSRDDTLAAHMEWSYRTGALADTLLGKWVREPNPEPYAADRADSIYVAVIRRLVAMQVVTRDPGSRHCLVIADADPIRHARLTAIARRLVGDANRDGVFAGSGCESDSSTIRLTLPRVHRTEDNRAVVHPSGDRLLEWPRNLQGESWRRWEGRCIGVASGRGTVSMDCMAEPEWRGEKLADTPASTPRRAARPSVPEPMRLRLRITSAGAYWIDTLQTTLRGPLPALAANAITDSVPRCNSWEVLSAQRAKDLLVFDGDPYGSDLSVTAARYEPKPLVPAAASSVHRTPGRAKFAAFLLGDVGARASAPITLRFEGCGRAYVLDPARHTLTRQAHARFRLRDLREQTRVTSLFGTQVYFRIDLDPAPSDVAPLVVVHHPEWGRYSAWWPRLVAPGTWEYMVMYGDGYSPETTMSVYLLRR
jgi:hypothetical protein